MCLMLSNCFELGFREDYFIGYKILYGLMNQTLYSAYQEVVYKLGEFNQSNRFNTQLTEQERLSEKVSYGIHVFVDRENAERALVTLPSCNLFEVLCPKEDFVAKGCWDCSPFYPQAVFDRVKLIKKVEYKLEDYPYIKKREGFYVWEDPQYGYYRQTHIKNVVHAYLNSKQLVDIRYYPENKVFVSKKLEV